MRALAAWALLLAALLLPGLTVPAVAQPCRQALALGLDVSGSVDMTEYRLQLDGLAAALEDAGVRAALLTTPGVPVWIAVFEWSGRSTQRLILDWRPLDSEAAIQAATATLRAWQRLRGSDTTGLGAAMEFGAALLKAAPPCGRATLDLSGDGKNNEWPRPRLVKNAGTVDGITINALVIGNEVNRPAGSEAGDIAELSAYFQEVIIHGPDAFIEVALGYGDYAEAMKRKLLREIETLAVGVLAR